MIKHQELQDPTSCLNRAHEFEWLFVLLARDPAAPAAIRFWVQERIRLGKNKSEDAQMKQALQNASNMEAQRASGALSENTRQPPPPPYY